MLSHFNFDSNQTISRKRLLRESQILFLFAYFESDVQRICQNKNWVDQIIQWCAWHTTCAPFFFLGHGFEMINMLESNDAIHHYIIR